MDRGEILKKAGKFSLLINPNALELLIEYKDEELLSFFEQMKQKNVFIVTVDHIPKKEKEEKKDEIVASLVSAFQPSAKDVSAEIKIYREFDVSGKSNCGGKIENFVEYFKDRLKSTKDIFKERMMKDPLVTLSSVKASASGKEVNVVVMVRDKRKTKNGHYMLDVEDETGEGMVLVLKDNFDLISKFNNVVTDEVLMINGRISSPFIFAKEIQFPDIPLRNERKRTEEDISMVFSSDFHIGSNNFLEKNFNKMVDWLKGKTGNERQQKLAGKIKYLFLAGDNVDGIGIYPNQERELVVKDIFKQYSLFEDFLESVPDYIHIFIIPGNHDAVRRADPQPSLPLELVKRTEGKGNIHYLGNPSFVEAHGVKVLMYHGCSLDSIIATMPGMEYGKPEKPMTEILKRRHLSPIYGKNPIVPEEKDYLVIREVPDIFHVGHVHKNGYLTYKGTLLINSGTWQAQTDYQAQQGHIPSPCILPVYNMKNAELTSIDFSGGPIEI